MTKTSSLGQAGWALGQQAIPTCTQGPEANVGPEANLRFVRKG